MSKDNFISCLKESDLPEGSMRAVRVKGKPILLAKVAGEVFGVSNYCPHEGCTFQSGFLREYLVMCPCHGWKFDLRTGQYQENPLITLTCYRTKVENRKILVEIKK